MKNIKDIVVIAHRGGASHHVENTLDSFLHGIKLGFKAIEMDLRYDYFRRRFFLEHDFLHHPRYKKNVIDNVINNIPKDIFLVLELKTNSFFTQIFARNYRKLHRRLFEDRKTLTISFNPFVLLELKIMAPEIELGFVCGNRFFKFLFQDVLYRFLKPEVYIVNKRFLNKRTVRYAKKHGMKIYSYVMNKSEERHKALDFNIDGIVTDYPL